MLPDAFIQVTEQGKSRSICDELQGGSQPLGASPEFSSPLTSRADYSAPGEYFAAGSPLKLFRI